MERSAPILLRLHFYAGILIGPFLLVAAATGLMYTATPQIEAVVYRHELKATPHGTTPEALSAQVAAARKAVPGGTLFSVTPATGRTDSTRVVFDKPDLPDNYTQTAFVNPYTTEVLGQERTFADWWLPVRAARTCSRARCAASRTAASERSTASAISARLKSKTSFSTNTARSSGLSVSSTTSMAIDTDSASVTASAASWPVNMGSGSHGPT